MKNIRQWQTTTIGIILFILNSYYWYSNPESVNATILIAIYFLTLVLFFAKDTLITSLKSLLKNNASKKL
jgi:hypothetical protein